MAHVLVVGAGLAGARMCQRLRAAGHSGRLTLVGAEPDPPYDRPPLTKDPGAEVDLRAAMGLDVWSFADEVRLGAAAGALRAGPGGLAVDLPGGALQADAVVVATGANPVCPTTWTGPGVDVLHTRAQAAALWAAVRPATRLVVVGGGWIGCEAAATAAARGAEVQLLEAGPHLLPGRIPAGAAARVAAWLADLGVGVRTGAPVTDVMAPGGASATVQVAGEHLAADRVLVALGVRPATDWLAGCAVGRDTTGAVLVDAWGRSDVPGVFAVGDAAATWSARLGGHRPGGHWTEALSAPEVVAPVVAGWASAPGDSAHWRAPVAGPEPDPVPYVFSEIAGRTLQLLGDPGAAGTVVWRESGTGWSAFVVGPDGRLRGVVGVGRPRDIAAARRAILAGPPPGPAVDPAALADPDASPPAMFPAADHAGVSR